MASTSSVDGLVSGMDTTALVSQLMSLERQPEVQLQNRQKVASVKVAALQSVNAKVLALQVASNALTTADAWSVAKATSSSSAVSVSAGAGASPGTYRFDVVRLAKAQSYVSSTTFASLAAPATTATTISISKNGGTAVAVAVGDGTLGSVVAAVNAANAGVRATATKVADGSYKLALTSTTTGASSDFTVTAGVDPNPLGALQELAGAQDARLSVGDVGSPGLFTVDSASNTVTDVVPGVTLNLTAEATGVTVDVTTDADKITSKVQAMVDAANAAITEINKQTSYDQASNAKGALLGDPSIAALKQNILNLASTGIGAVATPSLLGIQVTRTGSVSFDPSKFQDALRANPARTQTFFVPAGTTTHTDPTYAGQAATVTLLRADDRLAPGAWDVKVTQAATRASVTTSGSVDPAEDLTLTVPGKTAVHVLAQAGDDLQDLADKINAASSSHALGLSALVDGGDLIVRTVLYGSSPTFTMSTAGTLAVGATVAGLDVAGSINGVAATGNGQVLSAPSSDPTLVGLALKVTASAAQVAAAAGQAGAAANLFGNFSYNPGLGQRMDSLAGAAVRAAGGTISSSITGGQSLVDELGKQIDAFEQRMVVRERALRLQFTNLETALGKMRDQSNWLAGQLGSLPTSSSK
jgi:flagellar hook-associated protein 2